MHTLEVPQRGIRIEVPDHWNDMTADQVAFVFKWYGLLSDGRCQVVEFKLRVLFCFVPVTLRAGSVARLLSNRGAEVTENALWLYDQLFGYVLSDTTTGMQLNYDSPVQFFPTVGGGQGVGTLLSGMSFGDFLEASSKMQPSDDGAYGGLLSAVYKGCDPTHVAVWQKAWVLMWFRACLTHIQTSPVLVDGCEVDFSPLFCGGSSGDSRGVIDPWHSTLFSIAEGGVFGNTEAVKSADLYEVLMYLLKNQSDAKNRKY